MFVTSDCLPILKLGICQKIVGDGPTLCRKPATTLVQDGSTPLHYAAAFGQTGVIRTLMESGCPVDATDDAENTPLHLAAGGQSLLLLLTL